MRAIVAHNEHARPCAQAARPQIEDDRRGRRRILLIAFGLSNRNDVPIDWLVGTTDTPLIIVIVVSAALGAILGAAAVRGRSKRAGSRDV